MAQKGRAPDFWLKEVSLIHQAGDRDTKKPPSTSDQGRMNCDGLWIGTDLPQKGQ